MGHRWPGNVRELENEIERLWVLSGDDTLIGDEILSSSIGRGATEVLTATAPGAKVPDNNPNNPKYRYFISAWKRLPLAVANVIGPRLVRGLG